MYILDESLLYDIKGIARRAAEATQNTVRFEEYIALPFFGQIILRFDLDAEEVTLDMLDSLESMLYDIVGDDYLIDFMGSVYNKVGVDHSGLAEKLEWLSVKLDDEPIIPSVHCAGVSKDAKFLLEKAGLAPDTPVWEIQVEDGELLLLILGEAESEVKEVSAEPKLFVGTAKKEPCIGLIKAAFYAKRNRISLARLLIEDGNF